MSGGIEVFAVFCGCLQFVSSSSEAVQWYRQATGRADERYRIITAQQRLEDLQASLDRLSNEELSKAEQEIHEILEDCLGKAQDTITALDKILPASDADQSKHGIQKRAVVAKTTMKLLRNSSHLQELDGALRNRLHDLDSIILKTLLVRHVMFCYRLWFVKETNP